MLTQFATTTVLDAATRTTEYSQPISMDGANAVQCSYVILQYSLSGGTPKIEFQLQISDDLENWSDSGTADSATTVRYLPGTKFTGISSAYVRIEAVASGTNGTVIYSGMLNTSYQ